jgi:hypothetical protein
MYAPGRLSGLYAWTAAYATIESSDGTITLNGLVSGLSRADLLAAPARTEHALGSGWTDPLDANYWRVRRATELGS